MNPKYRGTLRPRKYGYLWRVRVGGKRHSYRILTTSPPDPDGPVPRAVVQEVNRKHAELKVRHEAAGAGRPVDLSLHDLLDRFERERLPEYAPGTQRSYRSKLAKARAFWKSDPLASDVTGAEVHRWLQSLKVGNRTRNLYFSTLSGVFSWAEKLDLIPVHPFRRKVPRPKYDAPGKLILTDEELGQLIELARTDPDPAMYGYVVLLAETGIRSGSEAEWLKWDDLGDQYIAVGRHRRTKSGKERQVRITSRLLQDALAEHRRRFDDGTSEWVFHHLGSGTNRLRGERRPMRRAFGAFVKRARKAGFNPVNETSGKRFSRHALRHTRVTRWLREGRPVHIVKEAMGHADLKTTLGYYAYLPDHQQALDDSDLVTDPQVTRLYPKAANHDWTWAGDRAVMNGG